MGDPVGCARRMNSSAEERFVGVNVAHADDEAVIHQRELDRRAPAASGAIEVIGVEFTGERLGSKSSEQPMLALGSGSPQYRAKAPRVAVAQHDPARELKVQMIVCLP